jgi:hypothetical protein
MSAVASGYPIESALLLSELTAAFDAGDSIAGSTGGITAGVSIGTAVAAGSIGKAGFALRGLAALGVGFFPAVFKGAVTFALLTGTG